jgi:hypothetical protein
MVADFEEGGSGTRNISGKHRFVTEKYRWRKAAQNVAKATCWSGRHNPKPRKTARA